jgi:hypothetical protein
MEGEGPSTNAAQAETLFALASASHNARTIVVPDMATLRIKSFL